ncbi:MAG TPA: PKD domain-containing protein [Saprospiraceae bacterium]|nr:PKD domain-containing protein [Saprospiraceae bacterium]
MNRNLTPETNFNSFQQDERKKLFDFLFWISLFFIGCGLIFYLFFVNPVGDNTADNSNYIEGHKELTHHTTRHPNSSTTRIRKNWIKYSGHMVTFDKVVFTLNGYDKAAKYAFDFGDGTEKVCKTEKISHYYTKPGKYTVRVKVYYDNKSTEAWSETLTIKKGFTVDPSAYRSVN